MISDYTVTDLLLLFRLSLLTFGAIFLLKWLWNIVRDRQIYNKIPQIPSTYLLGNILGHLEYFWLSDTHLPITVFFGNVGHGLSKVFHQENVGLFYFRIGPFRNIVMVVKARTAETIFNSTKNIIKAKEYDFLKPWLGEGLLTAQGKHWKSHRKLLTPTFHFGILEKFIPTMSSKIQVMLSLIEKNFDPSTGVANIADIRPYVTNCTVDIICETAMGIKMSGQEEWWSQQSGDGLVNTTAGSRYAEAVRSYLEIMLKRLITPWMMSDTLFRFLPMGRTMAQNIRDMHGFTNKVILARKAELEGKYDASLSIEDNIKNLSSGKRMAFLDLVLAYHFNDPKEMDLVSLREEVSTFMFGGHDTTSTTLHFAFLLLGINIDKQKKIQDELDELFGDDRDVEITLDDIKKMTYLDMSVREVMRLYPPAAFIARNVVEEIELDGYKVPVGATLMILNYGVMRDPELFPQPEHYIPERFEPGGSISKNPYAYVPFSAGPRNCIGQRFAMLELKLFLASVFRQYNVRTLTKLELVEVDISIITKSNSPIQVQFTRRDK